MLPRTVPSKARAWLARAVVAGPVGALTLVMLIKTGVMPRPSGVSLHAAMLMLLVAPVLEELAFRGAVMDGLRAVLARIGVQDVGPLTCSNVMTSLAFAACHLPYQSAAMAMLILLPSLLLGRLREVAGSVLPCIAIHAWFNAWYVMVVATLVAGQSVHGVRT